MKRHRNAATRGKIQHSTHLKGYLARPISIICIGSRCSACADAVCEATGIGFMALVAGPWKGVAAFVKATCMDTQSLENDTRNVKDVVDLK